MFHFNKPPHLLPGVKWPRREADRSPPSSDEIRMRSCTSAPLYAFTACTWTTLHFYLSHWHSTPVRNRIPIRLNQRLIDSFLNVAVQWLTLFHNRKCPDQTRGPATLDEGSVVGFLGPSTIKIGMIRHIMPRPLPYPQTHTHPQFRNHYSGSTHHSKEYTDSYIHFYNCTRSTV